MIKAIKRLFRLLVLLCVGLLILTLFLLGTEPGIEVDFALAKAFLPGHLSGEVRGRVLGHIRLQNLSYQGQTIHLKINEFELKWLPIVLLHGTFRIETLNIQGVQFEIHENHTEPSPPSTHHDAGLPFPLLIEIENSQFSDINIEQHPPLTPIHIQQAHITGKVILANTGITSDISGQWQNFNWQFSPKYQLKLPQGTITAHGPLSNYQYHITGQALSEYAAPATADIKGSGSLEHLIIDDFTGTLLDGRLQGHGQLAWHEGFTWQGTLTAEQLNPSYYAPKLAGSVNFSIEGAGLHTATTTKLHVNLNTLTGTVANYPLQGHVGFVHQNGVYTIDPSQIKLGEADIKLQGQLGSSWNMQWLIHFPHLNTVLDKGEGALDSQGQIQGSAEKPIINATLNGTNLAYDKSLTAAKLSASLHFDTATQNSSNLNILLTQIKSGSTQIDSLNLQGKGTLAQHRLSLLIQQQKDSLALKLDGGYNSKSWATVINTLNLNSSFAGNWTLAKPVAFNISKEDITLAPLCWQSQQTKLCIEFKKQQANVTGQVTLASFNLSRLQNLFVTSKKNQPELQGSVNGKLVLNGTMTKPNISGEAKLQGASLTVPQQGLTLKNINFNIQGHGNTLQYTAQAQSGPGTINLTGNTDLAQPGFPTQLKINGTNVQVSNTDSAQVIASPNLTLVYKAMALETTGTIIIPKAHIAPTDFSSTVEMPNDVVYTDEEKKETRALLMTTHITVTLGDAVHFTYKGLDADITGTLELKDYPSGATTANGELIISQGKFAAYGQNLTIREGRLLFAGGAVTNPGISVQAVRYVNTLSSAANADSTTNNAGKTMVGINVAGTVQQPLVTLFSIPSGLSQTQILSYLVLGHSLDQSNAPGDGQTIAQAAMALNLAGGTVSEIQNKVKSVFGLSEFEIGQQQEYTTKNVSSPTLVQNTSLILGKYLTPKLYANISVGLAEPINTLNVSYQMTQHWRVESNANSMGSGLDLIYSIERDQFKIFHPAETAIDAVMDLNTGIESLPLPDFSPKNPTP